MGDNQSHGDEVELDRDTTLSLLSHAYRRALLDCLEARSGAIPLADATEAVARRNDVRPIDEIPADELERVSLSLYHTHIPKLADEGAVGYDFDRRTVALTERGERLAAVQRRLSDPDERPLRRPTE